MERRQSKLSLAPIDRTTACLRCAVINKNNRLPSPYAHSFGESRVAPQHLALPSFTTSDNEVAGTAPPHTDNIRNDLPSIR